MRYSVSQSPNRLLIVIPPFHQCSIAIGRTPSGLGFYYNGKLVKLGDDLTQAEAESLVAAIIREFPENAELWNTYDSGLPEMGESE